MNVRGRVAQWITRQPSKLKIVGSIPTPAIYRLTSNLSTYVRGPVAHLVEHRSYDAHVMQNR